MNTKLQHLYKQILGKDRQHDNVVNEQKQLRFLNQIFLVGLLIPIFYTILLFILDLQGLYFVQLLLFITSLSGYFLSNRYKKLARSTIVLFIMPLELTYFPVFVGNIGAEYFGFIFLVIGYYIIDKKIQLFLLTLYLTTLLLVSKYFIFQHNYPEKYEVLATICYYPNIIITVFLVSSSTFLFKSDTIKYEKTIEAQAKDLENKVDELQKRESMLTRLLSELNHRVKNNLQFVSSLFTIQIYSSGNKEIKKSLEIARNRIDTISLLYQHLYKKDSPLSPDLRKYISELSQFALQMSGLEEVVDLEMDVDEMYLSGEVTSHIGLIINELLTNTLKYGFDNNTKNQKIFIGIKKGLDKLIIEIRDTGKGFPVLNHSIDSFGMKLITTIAHQYNGNIKLNNNEGAQVKIELYLHT